MKHACTWTTTCPCLDAWLYSKKDWELLEVRLQPDGYKLVGDASLANSIHSELLHGLEDRILLRSLGQRQRHLDQKKVTQLSAILEGMINEAASANEEVSRHAVQFTKVKVNCSFTDVRVWWLCTGVNDEEIEAVLKSQRHNLRKTLSDSIGVNCPEIQFEPDRSELMMQEMDRLFRMADYGMDYRAVSHTGRVLGNAESPKPEKWKPISRKKKDNEETG
ncbi:hypothetical protein ANCCEY_14933 [Ancylostoma ceylanicum]|uniref:Ribosome-binding factor A n=1 Tax=Ancylostoma ceylanicum TaxID=53326 RepID=A0A0D6L8M6_9BILA|nr:hypothetical protein ANCCEY_14933 [Ancylostoma ceylanicum]